MGGASGILCGGITLQEGISGILIALTPISGISGMKSERFTGGTELFIERNRRREGPPIVYTVRVGDKAMLFTDPKRILRFAKWPKGTPTGDALREWLAGFDEADAKATAPKLSMDAIKAEGFGPEAHADEDDPTANTKMVT